MSSWVRRSQKLDSDFPLRGGSVPTPTLCKGQLYIESKGQGRNISLFFLCPKATCLEFEAVIMLFLLQTRKQCGSNKEQI